MTIGIQTVNDVPETTAASQDETTVDYWLGIARDAYSTSTDYFDANIRKQLERNVYAFRSKHAPGSKYHTDQYKFRSKIYRPKVRSAIRKSVAACGVAFFATGDAVSITPNNPDDPKQCASAAVNQELINYRLDKSIPWFMTLSGAFVDAKVQGLCISKQEWAYEESVEHVDQGSGMLREHRSIVTDKPTITLIPAENFRFSAASNWIDPIKSSPFLIHLEQMFVGDIQQKMTDGEWLAYTEAEIVAAVGNQNDTTQKTRQGNRTDASQQTYQERAFDCAWVREFIVRHKGRDVVFTTLGDRLLLSPPRELKDVYHHGVRPYVIGFIDVEPHKNYPSGSPELAEGLSVQANDIANHRLDNVKLVLNKRYFGRRGSSVDWDMLRRSVPGGIVMMDSFDAVKPEEMNDVTGSSYQEQDRVNMDIDEIMGSFSQSSVATNRNLNETVGGLNLLSDGANAINEFELRVFSETWVEPVLRQLMLMEQTYENDRVILNIAGNKAQLFQKFGVDQITDDILSVELSCRVNVGFGATNPKQRIDRMATGLNAIGQYVPAAMQRLDEEAVITEVMGALGYRDGARFFKPADQGATALPPEIQKQMQDMQEELIKLRSGIDVANIRAGAAVQGKQIDADVKMQTSQMDRMSKAEAEHIKGQYAVHIAEMQGHLADVNASIKAADSETRRGELRLQANALQFEIAHQERQMQHEIDQVSHVMAGTPSQVIMNDRYGKVPYAQR